MNFRARIITTFLLFAVIFTLVFGLLLNGLMNFVEDEITRDFLTENMEYFEEKLQREANQDVLITTPKIQGYFSYFQSLPTALTSLPEGFHETEASHVLVKTLKTGIYAGETLILEFDEASSFLDQNEGAINIAILIFSLIVITLAAVVCVYLAKSIASPIEYLANKVSTEAGDISDSPVLKRRDELGSLARAFATYVARIHDLLEREKNFTRYTSHELRTPLTVVKNNIDILRVTTGILAEAQLASGGMVPKTYDNSVKRLEQAVWFMEQQLNTLLLLARGEYQPKLENVRLSPLISDLEFYFPDLTLEKTFDSNVSANADFTVLLSIFANALNNVMEHGMDNNGKANATVTANSSGFSISNSISPIARDREGKRFGLEIVQQLCDVMHWACILEEKQGENGILFSLSVDYHKTLNDNRTETAERTELVPE